MHAPAPSPTVTGLPHRPLRLWAAAVGFLVSAGATAPGMANPAPDNDWPTQAQRWIQEQLVNTTGQAPTAALRPEVTLGRLDSRLQLAPCDRVEPYLPQGTRLWGRSRIGLRCVEGPKQWNVFLPITVKAWGPAWVIRQPVPHGTVLTQEMAELAEIDWAESSQAVLAKPEDWIGQETSRALVPGQVLRHSMVKPRRAFDAGTEVKVRAIGPDFGLTTSGQALSHGFLGQTARVRLSNGRVVSGLVRDSRTVDIRL